MDKYFTPMTVSENAGKHTIKLFEDYLKNPDTHSTRAPKHRCIEELPLWSKNILEKFIEERHQEGFSEKTLTMCRSAGCRFFFDLEKNGIRDAENITPESVINFCLNDQHGTPESKNAYGIKLRQLLMFMADNGLVPPNTCICSSYRLCAEALYREYFG